MYLKLLELIMNFKSPQSWEGIKCNCKTEFIEENILDKTFNEISRTIIVMIIIEQSNWTSMATQ